MERVPLDAALLDEIKLTLLDGQPSTSELISKASFADIYKLSTPDRSIVAKVYTSPKHASADRLEDWEWRIDCILKNIEGKRELLSNDIFANPLVVNHDNRWYALKFVDGRSAQQYLDNDKLTRPEEFAGRAALTYAKMLQHLHAKDSVFYDNNWGALVLGADDTHVCDYDFVSSVNEIQEPWHFARAIHQVSYASREQLLSAARESTGVTKSSDLESLALMLDHLYTGKELHQEILGQAANRIGTARANKYEYPADKIPILPAQLQDVIIPLINYPRDDSIRIDDVVGALELHHSK